MAKPEMGLKRVCVACGTRFYDLTRQPAVCPKCATEQPAEQPRVRRGSSVVADEKLNKRAVVPAAEGDDVELEDVETDDAVEDVEELEDDAESIDGAIEVATDTDEEG